MIPCALCKAASELFFRDKKREYWRCSDCDLIFVPSKYHLSSEKEKREYDYHENDPLDPEYRKFLSQVADPLGERLKEGMEGLDFGSGPGPTLHSMLREKGFCTSFYDPFYAHHPHLLERQYDFVTCTEVVEHFYDPAASWALLSRLVKRGGYLAIMTLFWDSSTQFSTWWYKNNETHVAFYSMNTLQWIAREFSFQLIPVSEKRVAFLLR